MSKKALVIVGLAAVLAVSGGAISIAGSNSSKPVEGGSNTVAATDAPDNVAPEDNVTPTDSPTEAVQDETSAEVEDNTVSLDGDDKYGYEDDIVSVDSFGVSTIIDNTDGRVCTAREVFGNLYYYCYLAFKSDGTFELCVNPVAGEIRKGRYSIYGNVISVLYNDGSGAEYDIVSNASGDVDYIIVKYGDYDVYFG